MSDRAASEAAVRPEAVEEPDAQDRALVARCQQELPYNTTAFAELVRRHEPVVFRTCLRFLDSAADAEEVSQDVFMRVFNGLPAFRSDSSFRTWLYRIVRNACATRGRKVHRRREHMEAYARHAADEAAAEAKATSGDVEDRVQQALRGLEKSDREVLTLRFVSDLSIQEVADALEIKLSAAKMRLYRAQERFQKAYETGGGPS